MTQNYLRCQASIEINLTILVPNKIVYWQATFQDVEPTKAQAVKVESKRISSCEEVSAMKNLCLNGLAYQKGGNGVFLRKLLLVQTSQGHGKYESRRVQLIPWKLLRNLGNWANCL